MTDYVLHHGSSRKVKRRSAEHRECCLVRVNLAKFAGGDTVFNQATEMLEKWMEVLFRDPLDFGRRIHRFALNEARIIRMTCQEIKVAVNPGAKTFAGRGILRRRRVDNFSELAKKIFE